MTENKNGASQRGVNSLAGPRGRIRSTWQLMNTPYSTYADWQARYGKTFLIKALNGNVIATSNVENIRRVLATRHDETMQFAIGTIAPLIGESSVAIVSGQRHKRARSMLIPPFQGDALRCSIATMKSVAERSVKHLKAGDQIKVMDISLDYSLEVIIQVVFGVERLDDVEVFKRAIKSYVKSFRPVFAFTRLLQNRLVPQWRRFLKQKLAFNQLLESQIQRRRQSDSQPDVLGMLLAARDEQGKPLDNAELRDQLISLLFAGHETTQIAIAWAMSWLHRHPLILQRLRKEMEEEHDPDQLLKSKLLDGICLESLRLNPIVADFLRVFLVPIQFEEVDLPANSNVGILTTLVHNDPEIYPNPGCFDPDRWADRTYKPYEFLAFGGGVRRCIGASMAVMEMKIALITWLRLLEFRLPDDAPGIEPVHRRNLTMAPRSGIKLIVSKDSH